jgi:hypothetical protein
VEGAARVQVQHAGVRLAGAQRGGVQGVQDGDEPVAHTFRFSCWAPPFPSVLDSSMNFSKPSDRKSAAIETRMLRSFRSLTVGEIQDLRPRTFSSLIHGPERHPRRPETDTQRGTDPCALSVPVGFV